MCETRLLQTQKTEPESIKKINHLEKQLDLYKEIPTDTKNSLKAIRGIK